MSERAIVLEIPASSAYLALVLDFPREAVAVVLTVLFVALNILGAKESSGLVRVLVVLVLGFLALLFLQGYARSDFI